MINFSNLYNQIKDDLASSGIENAANEAGWIIAFRMEDRLQALQADPDKIIPQHVEKKIKNDVALRMKGVPLARIQGVRDFWTLELGLNAHTLDPRPDSEAVIELALALFKDKPPQTMIDLGTGSGCLLLALLSEWKSSFGVGVDYAYDAITAARANAVRNRVADRAAFINGDWMGAFSGSVDLIVSNPPYISSADIAGLSAEVRNYDPLLALDGGETGMDAYKKILAQAPDILSKKGILLFETGDAMVASIVHEAVQCGFKKIAEKQDLKGIVRSLALQKTDSGDNS